MVKNKILTIQTDYLRPSRTIETILVSNNNREKVFYLYNYEGTSFRLFISATDLVDFFHNKDVDCVEFSMESELDNYLTTYQTS